MRRHPRDWWLLRMMAGFTRSRRADSGGFVFRRLFYRRANRTEKPPKRKERAEP